MHPVSLRYFLFKTRSWLLTGLLAIFFSSQLTAQFHRLRNYNVKDGLPSSDVYSIMQDSKGYIWVTGDMGVTRFDGYRFKNFSTQDGLADNTVFGLYEDHKHRIWFRSYSGKLSYFLNDSIYTIPCSDSLSKYFKRYINNDIYVDAGDTLWVGSMYKGIYKVSPGWKKDNLELIEVPGEGRYIYQVDGKGFLFGGHNDDQTAITVYNRSFHALYKVKGDITATKTSRFFVTRLSDNNYLATLENSAIIFNSTGIKQQDAGKATFICASEEKDKTILACTTSGMVIYHNGTLENKSDVWSLNGKVMTGVCVDRENEYWFATEGHGIYSEPHRHFKYYTPANGLPESKISAMGIVDSSVAVGHLDGTITLLKDSSISSLTVKSFKNTSPLVTRVFDIYRFSGLNFVGTPTSSYQIKKNVPHLLSDKNDFSTRQFAPSRDGHLWMLSYSVLIKFDPKTLKPVRGYSIAPRVDNIFEDSRGSLWLGGMEGLYVLDSTGTKFLGDQDEKFRNRPVAIREDERGNVWIATRGGGVVIRKNNETIQLTEKDGLAGNMCRCILIDSSTVWVGTNKGLSKITYEGKNFYFENFYASNGLLTNEVNYMIMSGGKLWLAHNNGVSIFDPYYQKDRQFTPPVYIQQTLVNNSNLTIGKDQQLKYDHNYITINYIGLCYKDAGAVEYKYKMVGVDSSWIYTHYTSVQYQTLPPGNYNFIVYARSNDGMWSSTPGTVSFTILPAWWQTWTARIIASLLFLGVVALVFRYRLSKINARDKEKMLLHQRVSETELQALRAQMNPHFIFNAINSVQYFITRNDPESSQRYLAKFARLIRYVVDNSKPALIPLKTELEALNLYLELESLRFENKFHYQFFIDKNINVNSTLIPSMLIQPYVENAIWHGLMHKKETGTIVISMTLNDDKISCVVKDDGIGRIKSAEIKQKTQASHKSLGLALTKERLDIINQVNKTDLSVVINDLYDSNNNARGTSVMISIPIKQFKQYDNINNS
jgi:ligand-binding sensor domain-containing protein